MLKNNIPHHLWWIILGFLLIIPTKSFCCTCPRITPQEAFQGADAVFQGQVIAIKSEQEAQDRMDNAGNPIFYTKVITHFQILDVWKGVKTPTVIISSIQNSTCHYGFNTPLPYLVYATKTTAGDTLTTSVCRRNSLYITAEISGELTPWAPEEKPQDADFDSSGVIDFTDFLLFASAYSTQDSRFDLFPDGTIDFPDFLKFAKWFGQVISEN